MAAEPAWADQRLRALSARDLLEELNTPQFALASALAHARQTEAPNLPLYEEANRLLDGLHPAAWAWWVF